MAAGYYQPAATFPHFIRSDKVLNFEACFTFDHIGQKTSHAEALHALVEI
ncbi:hypothetical protein SCIP_0920 [Scardovia inopinata JCM 12537]|nr:hypothetical protein SCIP_0920 [Scardovia inopinata JCM 12537]